MAEPDSSLEQMRDELGCDVTYLPWGVGVVGWQPASHRWLISAPWCESRQAECRDMARRGRQAALAVYQPARVAALMQEALEAVVFARSGTA